MALTQNDKEYLDAKFANVDLKHDHTIQRLDKINGTVQKHESELMEYRFFRKYPKALLFMTSLFSIWLLWEIIQNFIL